jgi:AraC-like DNA-binding protein
MHSKGFICATSLSKEQFKKIEPIVLFLQQNFCSPLTLNDICSAVKYNKYTVCHTFKAVTGSSVFDYVNFLRVQYAVSLIKNTRLCVSQIADKCAFSTPTYFNRVFKRIMGSSPSVYRKFLTPK